MPFLPHSGVVAADGLSNQQRKQRLFVERTERIEIPLPHDRLRRREQHDDHDAPEHQPDPVQRADKQQQHQPQQLEGIAELIARLGEVRDGDERHVGQHLRHEPVRLHSKIAEHERAEHAERV